TVSDGTLESAVATVAITVHPVNDTPEADAFSASVFEDESVEVALSGLDVEHSPLTFEITAPPQHGTLTALSPSTFTFTPAENYPGPGSFAYVANDGSLSSFPAIITLTVEPVNDAPVVAARDFSTDEEADVLTPLAGTDIDGDALTFEVLVPPSHGQLL